MDPKVVSEKYPEESWTFRSSTLDRAIFNGVVILNEYRLPEEFAADDVVIDVGAHIGSFAYAVLSRDCQSVYCFEPDRENCEITTQNLRPFIEKGLMHLARGAVWRSDPNDDELFFDGYHPFPKSYVGMEGIINTGSGSVLWGRGENVPKLGFDDIVDSITNDGEKRIRLLKLDCEGAEWPILLTSRRLQLIDQICGEFHEIGGEFLEISEGRQSREPVYRLDGPSQYTIERLLRFLNDAGFTATFQRHQRPTGEAEGLGLFFATRRHDTARRPSVRPANSVGETRHSEAASRSKPEPRSRLIAIGYNTFGTGLTRVMQSIMGRLADRHEIHFLGICYSGEEIHDRGLTIYPTNPNGGDVFAAFQAKRLIEEINPSLIFIMHDIWAFEYYLRILGPYRDRLRIIGYIPLDGNIINEDDAAPLAQADSVVVYTEWARNQFEQAFARLRKKQGGDFPKVEVIPHWVELQQFYPFPELLEAGFAPSGRVNSKRSVFGERQSLDESFVVLNASRPGKRKRVDLTIKGFAKFAADKPHNVRLCLHHAIMGEPEEAEIKSLIRQLGLEKRVLLNPFGGGVVSDTQLNLLYNACDVGINTSMGEGWGLVSFEHGAAGAAQIVPDHSACSELWSGRAELIPPARSFIPDISVLEMGEVSPEGVARALENLYRDPNRTQELARAAFAAAQNPRFSWDIIARQFEDLFVGSQSKPSA